MTLVVKYFCKIKLRLYIINLKNYKHERSLCIRIRLLVLPPSYNYNNCFHLYEESKVKINYS